jgi:hypothetical protein
VEIPGQDELTKGTLNMVRTKNIPIWLVLAFQVQLDIHYMFLKDTSRAQAKLSLHPKLSILFRLNIIMQDIGITLVNA